MFDWQGDELIEGSFLAFAERVKTHFTITPSFLLRAPSLNFEWFAHARQTYFILPNCYRFSRKIECRTFRLWTADTTKPFASRIWIFITRSRTLRRVFWAYPRQNRFIGSLPENLSKKVHFSFRAMTKPPKNRAPNLPFLTTCHCQLFCLQNRNFYH